MENYVSQFSEVKVTHSEEKPQWRPWMESGLRSDKMMNREAEVAHDSG